MLYSTIQSEDIWSKNDFIDMVLLEWCGKKPSPVGKKTDPFDTFYQPQVLEWRVVTDLAIIASLILTILHLKKGNFFFLHLAPLLKQDKHRGSVRRGGMRGKLYRINNLLSSSKFHFNLEMYLRDQKLFLSESAKRSSVIHFFFFLDAKEHCKLLRTLLSFAEVPPQVFAKRRCEKELSHHQQPFLPPRSHHARCDR